MLSSRSSLASLSSFSSFLLFCDDFFLFGNTIFVIVVLMFYFTLTLDFLALLFFSIHTCSLFPLHLSSYYFLFFPSVCPSTPAAPFPSHFYPLPLLLPTFPALLLVHPLLSTKVSCNNKCQRVEFGRQSEQKKRVSIFENQLQTPKQWQGPAHCFCRMQVPSSGRKHDSLLPLRLLLLKIILLLFFAFLLLFLLLFSIFLWISSYLPHPLSPLLLHRVLPFPSQSYLSFHPSPFSSCFFVHYFPFPALPPPSDT